MCQPRAPSKHATGSRIRAELCTLFRLAWPRSVTELTSFAPRLFLLVAVGHLEDGAVLVGAAGIGTMYANFAHSMMLRSTTFGAMPLFTQAFGAGNHHLVGLALMRVMLLHLFMGVCVALPLTAIAGPLLLLLGQPDAVASGAQTFLWIRLVGLPGQILLIDVLAFQNAQRLVKLPMLVVVGGGLAQTGLVYLLTARLGFVGAPWAMTLIELLQGVLLLAVTPWLLHRNKLRSWPAWRRDAWQATRGWLEIVTRGGNACVMVMSEWFGWECTLFIASGLCQQGHPAIGSPAEDAGSSRSSAGDACPAIEAIPICTTIFVCQFFVAFGPGLAANVRVSRSRLWL